jgi:hypothetical protein
MWELSEPVGESRFRLLDRYLLRRVFNQVLNNAFTGSKKKLQIDRAISQLLDSVDLPIDWSRDRWHKFLTGDFPVADPNPLALAAINSPPGAIAAPLEVASRAYLLLRLATGACNDLLDVVRPICSPSDLLGFWWHNLGSDRGLWNIGSAPNSAEDLWLDVRDAMNDMCKEIDSGKTSATILDFTNSWKDCALMFGGTERIGFWGLGL